MTENIDRDSEKPWPENKRQSLTEIQPETETDIDRKQRLRKRNKAKVERQMRIH